MKINKLAPGLGVEITGVQMSELEGEALNSLKAQVYENGVAVLRDQELSPDQHIAFAKRWGGIDVNPFFPTNSGWPEIAEVRKAEDQKDNIGGGWHTDHSFDAIPAMGSILVARELPPVGGDTLFSSMGAAYDSLSDGLKQTLGSLRAVHSADHIYQPDGYYSKTDLAGEMTGQDLSTRAVHPVVVRHPVTGRKVLYINGAFTLHFEGWTREESLPLLRYLIEVGSRDEFQCRVQWQPGSVAIWDNRATWHLAMNDYHGHRRVMHRITLTGEPLAA
ncbi:MAG: TauD/TfdA family dioxygenase [Novosphingobium sp.]|uniref:TauD/TfdA dioxygenase family protein n=1 Tax=Novosphingobium sp. TaxID=1874826 RepID=UPI003C7D8F7D